MCTTQYFIVVHHHILCWVGLLYINHSPSNVHVDRHVYTSQFWNVSLWFNFSVNSPEFVKKNMKWFVYKTILNYIHTLWHWYEFCFSYFDFMFAFKSLFPATCILVEDIPSICYIERCHWVITCTCFSSLFLLL